MSIQAIYMGQWSGHAQFQFTMTSFLVMLFIMYPRIELIGCIQDITGKHRLTELIN